jgi:phage-related protein
VFEIVFFVDGRGREPVLEYIRQLGRVRPVEAAAIERYIDRLADKGDRLGMPMARLIDRENRLFELRPGAHRVAYARAGDHYVLLHAWRKTSQKLDRQEAGIALSRLRRWAQDGGRK